MTNNSTAPTTTDIITNVGKYPIGWVIPTNMLSSLPGYEPKKALEAAGVEFQYVLEEFKSLQVVRLPEGWKIDVVTHRCESGTYYSTRLANLLDDRGRVRAVIRRWGMGIQWAGSYMIVACPFMLSFKRQSGVLVARVRRRYGTEVFRIIDFPRAGESLNDFKSRMRSALRAKLSKEFPGWQYSEYYWSTNALS